MKPPSDLTIGASNFGQDTGCPSADEDAVELALRSLTAGHSYIDTSNNYVYGRSETVLGVALARLGQECSPEVITKVDADPATGRFDRDRVMRSFEESLQRLGIGHVPLLHLHDPDMLPMAESLGPGGAVAGLVELRESGAVDAIGVAGGPIPMMSALSGNRNLRCRSLPQQVHLGRSERTSTLRRSPTARHDRIQRGPFRSRPPRHWSHPLGAIRLPPRRRIAAILGSTSGRPLPTTLREPSCSGPHFLSSLPAHRLHSGRNLIIEAASSARPTHPGTHSRSVLGRPCGLRSRALTGPLTRSPSDPPGQWETTGEPTHNPPVASTFSPIV